MTLQPAAKARKPRIALVLGSGGLKCAAALGVQRVLKRENIPIDMLVGCSGGGIYASMLALGYDRERAEDITRRGWTKRNLTRYRYRPIINMLLPQFLRSKEPFCILDDRPFMGAMREAFEGKTFEDTNVPLFLLTTDMATGEKVILDRGPLLDAVRATMSIPMIFQPWPVGSRLLADGAMANPLPIDVAIRENADVILAMGFELPCSVDHESLSSVANLTISTMINALLASTFAFHSAVHHAEIIPILPTFEHNIALFDTHLLPHIIEQGERATEEQVPYLRRLLSAA